VRNAFDTGSIHYEGKWGLGTGNLDFFGPCEMASSRQASAIWGPNKSRFTGPNPLPLAHLP
jgi:hypothetical protein